MLTCTAEDILPLADACKFKSSSVKTEYAGRLHKWDPTDRLQLQSELDAAFFHLYSLNQEQVQAG